MSGDGLKWGYKYRWDSEGNGCRQCRETHAHKHGFADSGMPETSFLRKRAGRADGRPTGMNVTKQ